jgi:hypothetical protein
MKTVKQGGSVNTVLLDILFEKIVSALDRAALLSKENEKELKDLKEEVLQMMKTVLDEDSEFADCSENDDKNPKEYFSKRLKNQLFIDKLEFGGNEFKSIASIGRSGEMSFDILLMKDDVICIVDTQRIAYRDHINKLLGKASAFRKNFKAYVGHKIFLGIGALSFDEGVEDEAKKYGMGILKPNGDAVVVYDKNLKVY